MKFQARMMPRSKHKCRILAGVSLAAVLGTAVALHGDASRASAGSTVAYNPQLAVDNPLVREPIVFWDVSGFTLLGPLHSRLAVYNDGTASISSASSSFLGSDSSADFTFVGIDDITALRHALGAAGAAAATDSDQFVSDVPLQTVTFFRKPGPKAQSNSFNFWLADEPDHQAVLEVLNDFIDAHFPGFGGSFTK